MNILDKVHHKVQIIQKSNGPQGYVTHDYCHVYVAYEEIIFSTSS